MDSNQPGEIDRHSLPKITEDVKRTWQRARHDISAGGVAYRFVENRIEVALISTRGGTRWQLPKGSREEGESALITAIREVEEEVGLGTELIDFIQSIDFWYWDTYRKIVPELVHKRVDFYLLKAVSGILSDASHEVDGVAWFAIDQALEVLTFEGERGVVESALARLTPSALGSGRTSPRPDADVASQPEEEGSS